MLELEASGKGRVNRPEASTRAHRRWKRLVGKQTWFLPKKEKREGREGHPEGGQWSKGPPLPHRKKEREKEQPVEGVLYVPFTPHSSLKKRMQEEVDKWRGNPNSGMLRVVERQGPTIRDLLANPTPWTKEACSKEFCAPCRTKPGSCRPKNVTYRIDCSTCSGKGVTAAYFGESNRTLWDRSQEHLALLARKQDNSVLYKHWEEEHEDRKTPPDFSFSIMGRHSSATERQLKEALAISYEEVDILLNSKSEFGSNAIIITRADNGKGWGERERHPEGGQWSKGPPSSHPQGQEEGGRGTSPARKKRKRQEDLNSVSIQLEVTGSEKEGTKTSCEGIVIPQEETGRGQRTTGCQAKAKPSQDKEMVLSQVQDHLR